MKRKITMRLLIAVLVMCAMVSFAAPVFAFDQHGTGVMPSVTVKDPASAKKFMRQLYGDGNNGWNFDGLGEGNDCVDLAKMLIFNVSGGETKGNAREYAYMDLPSGWERRYYPAYTPQPGDIAVWTGGEYGHVLLVEDYNADNKRIYCIDQDSTRKGESGKLGTGAVEKHDWNASSVTCYLVPTFNLKPADAPKITVDLREEYTDCYRYAVDISWDNVSRATVYDIYRATESVNFTKIGSTSDCHYTDHSVVQGKTSYYKVKARNSYGESDESITFIIWVPVIKPWSPPITVLGTSDGFIKITWPASNYATSYEVYRATSKTGSYKKIITTAYCEFKDFEVTSGKTYYYKVRGINGKTTGEFGNVASCKCPYKPGTPVIRTSVNGSAIKISWNYISHTDTYVVYRSETKSGGYSRIGSTKNRYYNDSKAAAGKTYYYKVQAVNSTCDGNLSSIVSGKIPLNAPAIRATVSGEKMKISWKAVKFADHYEVYRATSKTGTYKLIADIEDLYYTDYTAEIGVTYYYKVLSKNGSINGAESKIISAKVPLPKPAAPVISVASSDNGVTVSYGAVKHAKTYLIYRSTYKYGSYSKIGSTNQLSYTDTTAKANKTYYYKVRAQNAAGTSGYSSVKSLKYNPAAMPTGVKVGDTIKFGHYEQDNIKSNGKEAIEWLVLDVQGGRALLISKYALDSKPYNDNFVDTTWEKCTLRKWLNGSFKNAAFTAEELAKIPTVTVPAHKNPDWSTNPGNATRDQIFLLSITEATKYFRSDAARKVVPTKYAKAQGVFTFSYYTTATGEATCMWWLRSPGPLSICAAFVYYDGGVYSRGCSVEGSSIAVRPALWVNLGS